MGDDAIGCPAPGSTGDRAAELQRQARLVDDLFERVAAIRLALPTSADREGWRGPAADLFAAVVDEEAALLTREVKRLDGVRWQLRGEVSAAEAHAPTSLGFP